MAPTPTQRGLSKASPIRVLALIKGLGPGGAERLLVSSALHRGAGLSSSVAFLLPHKVALVNELERLGVETRCIGSRSVLDPRWLLRLRRLLTTSPVDVVHVHSPVVAVGTRLVLHTIPRGRRPRLVTTEHNVWASHARLTRAADALTASLDDAHIAVSAAVRDSMPARLREQTQVVRYGIELDRIASASAARADVRAALGISAEELVIGTVANLRATKGYPDLVAAASLVAERCDRVRFIAIGQGPLETEIRQLHAESGLGDRFRLLGYRADALEVMSGFDVFCLASHHEGLPIAMMEALALGIPIVATSVGGVPELVTGGLDAVLVPPRRPELLADALVELLEDPDRRAALAQRSRERRDELSVEHAVRRVEALYRKLVVP